MYIKAHIHYAMIDSSNASTLALLKGTYPSKNIQTFITLSNIDLNKLPLYILVLINTKGLTVA